MVVRTCTLFFALTTLVVLARDITSDPDWPEFQDFVENYRRVYSTPAETAGRFSIFKDNLLRIKERNAQSKMAKHAVNIFADLTKEEFKVRRKGYKKSNSSFAKPKEFPNQEIMAATSIDWRQLGAVTPVKDQGQCGSCWAFSATEQIESDYFLRFNTLLKLSPQQVVSCDTVDDGCNGGDTVTAYQYVSGAGGQEQGTAYPYVSGTSGITGTCEVDTADFKADLSQAYYVSQQASQEPQMLQQITQSPISVCVDAEIWQTYESGVITTEDHCGTSLDHCVQVVGYNSADNYWLVRNSWGTDWGNEGYIWVEQGSNVCGIALEATIVTAARPQAKDMVV